MKQFFLLISVFIISMLCVNAQNWQTVRSGRIVYFTTYQNVIKASRIDSVNFDRDSVLYPMPHIQQLDYRCFTPRGHSWMGEKVIIQSNGVNLFFNNEKDTIRINTRARVGESWTLFEIKDSIKIEAEVKSAEIQTILGEPDSVKTIGFKVYDKNGLLAHHYLSEKTLIISKNSGFVRMMNFRVFPKVPNSSSFEILESFDLVGLTNPDRGVQNLTWLGVYDFQVGDEWHTLTKRWDWSIKPEYYNTWKTIWKILERKESKDSVFYRIERKESLEKIVEKWDNITYSFIHDTVTQVYKPDTLFDKLPGEPIFSGNTAFTFSMLSDGSFVKKLGSDLPISKVSNDSCWYYIFYDGGAPGYYLKGLGGPYYEYNEINRGDEKTLVYFKKGTTTWGTPLVITDVKGIETEDPIKVYPNPAADFVTIENRSGKAKKYIIFLTDMQGREVFRKETVISTTYKMDLSSYPSGAYLLKMQDKETLVSKVILKKP